MRKLTLLLEMVRFSHTIFALPFAILAAVLAAEGIPTSEICLWILGAMVGARSAAMTFNRIVDRHIDARNPRTNQRHLVTGSVSLLQAWVFFTVMAALFFVSSYMLNPLAFYLSPVALLIVLSYSLAKRWTLLCHFLLGLSLALAPVGAWVAVTGKIGLPSVLFAAVVLLWTTGFDVIYACQDIEADKLAGLKSIPARFGIAKALRVAAVLHLLMVIALALTVVQLGGGLYLSVSATLVALLLLYEHMLVKDQNLTRINSAFFNCNAIVSILLMVAVLLDVFVA